MSLTQVATIAVAAFTLAGCQSGQVYVASDTVLGLHAQVNTARTAGNLQFGYDRYFGAVVPRSVDLQGSTDNTGLATAETGREAAAVLDCSEVQVKGIFLTRFVEHLATGRAARDYAGKLKDTHAIPDSFFSCFSNP